MKFARTNNLYAHSFEINRFMEKDLYYNPKSLSFDHFYYAHHIKWNLSKY